MKNHNRHLFRFISIAGACGLILGAAAGCQKNTSGAASSGNDASNNTKLTVSIMLQSNSGDPLPSDGATMTALQKYTNSQISMQWVPGASYKDKLNIALSSGSLPDIVQADNAYASVQSAAKAGAFWEIGPYLNQYANLKKADKNIMNATKLYGKTYMLYRARPVARNGIEYRKDWLQNVGLSEPKTIDDFYNMLYAFTYKDPDKNGKNDTYGMIVNQDSSPFYVTLTWFGGGNGYVADKSGKLVPVFETSAYMENLKFWKKLYDNKVINQDFATRLPDAYKWRAEIENGKAGLKLGALDDADHMQSDMIKADPNTTGVVDVIGQVTNGSASPKNLATTGYNGGFFFTKKDVSLTKLKRELTFMDQLNDHEAYLLLSLGVEGRQYKVVGGKAEPISDSSIPRNDHQDINQLYTNVANDPGLTTYSTNTALQSLYVKESKLEEDDVKYCVYNPTAGYISQAYSTNGSNLDNIIETARVKFIVGQIDEKGFDDAVATWKKSGGDDVVKEYNQTYAESKKK